MTIWRREAFDDVIGDVSAGHAKVPQSEYLKEGQYAVVDQGKELVAGYTNEESHLCRAKLPVIVFGDHTRAIKYIDFPFCMGADGVKVLRPKIDADVKYLYHYLRQLRLIEAGYDRHFKYLKRSSILLPALAEQRRIAEVLDRGDGLLAKRRAVLSSLGVLTRSIFLNMFGDPATNPRGWRTANLISLGKITTGGTPRTGEADMFGGSIPFVTPGDLESDAPAKRRVTERGAEAAGVVGPGATLVCCIGATIGKIAKTTERTAFNQQINAVEWGEAVDGDYGFMLMRFFKPTIVAWGTSTTLPILKKSAFERIEVPIPPVDRQRVFSRTLRRVDQLRRSNLRSLDALEALFQSMQSRAFRGEL